MKWKTPAGGMNSGQVRVSQNVAGSFEGSIDLGGGPLASAGGDDVFVAKLDPRGNHVWSKRSGDRQAQHGRALAVDPSGNLVLAGDAQGALDFTGAAQSPDATSLYGGSYADA